MRRRDSTGEEVRPLVVFSEHLHGVNVAVLPVDEPLGHLGRVNASQKGCEIGRAGTQIGGQSAGYRLHQPFVFQVELSTINRFFFFLPQLVFAKKNREAKTTKVPLTWVMLSNQK